MIQITVIGVIFCIIAIIMFFKRIEYLMILTVIAMIFQSTSFMWIGDSRISVFEMCTLFLLIKFIVSRKKLKVDKTGKKLVLFAVLVCIGTVISSNLFSYLVIDDFHSYNGVIYHDNYVPLSFSTSTAVALLRLSIRVMVFIIITQIARSSRNCNYYIDKLLIYVLAIVLIIGIIQYLDTMEIINTEYLMKQIHDVNLAAGDAYYRGYDKLYSVFREPSYCGPWLNAMFWAIIISGHRLRQNKVVMGMILIEMLLSFSATAVVSFVIMSIIYVKHQKVSNNVILKGLVAILIIFLGSLSVGVVRRNLIETITKMSSSSGIERIAKIKYCYELFLKSKLMGIGFHQVESMTLLSGLLAQVGLISTLVFVYVLFLIIKGNSENTYPLLSKMFMVSILISTELSCAGLLYVEPFWFGMYLYAMESNEYNRKLYNNIYEGVKSP